jgi:hypothetical protein
MQKIFIIIFKLVCIGPQDITVISYTHQQDAAVGI